MSLMTARVYIALVTFSLLGTACMGPRMKTIQLMDTYDAATDSYTSCLSMHVVDTGMERLFFRYAIDENRYPVLESIVCAGTVVPESGVLELRVQPLAQPLEDNLAARVRAAEKSLAERIVERQHPDPLETYLIPDEYGTLPTPCIFAR
ncbi:MAG: hypothetical protein QM518_07735 [Verrucomicrobiota bacterium]|nr:hypothetical protein [Verrucomicrobiota bacterium]